MVTKLLCWIWFHCEHLIGHVDVQVPEYGVGCQKMVTQHQSQFQCCRCGKVRTMYVDGWYLRLW
jgi:hypothetical protein